MNSQDFIIEGINKIVNEYPFVQCTYQYDRFCNLHSVQVLPKVYLNNPDGFSNLQYSIKKEFVSLFPYERLSFFSTGNSIQVDAKNIVCVITGKYFRDHKEVTVFPDNAIFIPNVDSSIDKDANFALAA